MSDRVVAIVLAAGASERMGRPKQLLPYRDTTLVGAVVRAALGSGVDGVVVVVGAAADDVAAVLPGGVVVAHNPDFASGNLSSLRAGLAAAGDADAVVLLLGDMPQVTSETIDTLVAAWRNDRRRVAVVRYHGGIGHPFLLSSAAIGDVAALEGAKPLWRYVRELPAADRLEVAVAAEAPADVDTPADYEALLADEDRR